MLVRASTRRSEASSSLRLARSLALVRKALTFALTQLAQTLHNGWGILNVWDLIVLRPMRGGLVSLDHPFCTGLDPASGEPIWPRNAIYRSPSRRSDADDERILCEAGGYMAGMVRRVAERPGRPLGAWNRMPPAVYYIHGGVHFNGGWLLFDDFADAIRHFTDERFVREFRRFVREERREPLLAFRQAEPDPREYADFIGFIRRRLPYFANSNGRRPPIWGNASPWPVVNVVTGSWIRDVRMLRHEAGRRAAPRPPIAGRYFRERAYAGERAQAAPLERLLARLHEGRIALRGARGNVYFVDRRLWDEGRRFDPAPPRRLRDRLPSRWGRGRP